MLPEPKTGGPTLAEMIRDTEEWRSSRRANLTRCPHCHHTPTGTEPTERELVTLHAYLLHGQKGAAALRGVTLQTVKNEMSHVYRRLGVEGAMQAAFLLGKGDLDKTVKE